MAEALVGGSFLSAFLQVLFDRMASHEVLDFFKGQKINDRLLKKLKTIMISVSGVLDDAEAKQITKPALKEWLDELKDAVYEADDSLDEIAYEALRVEYEAGSQTSMDQVRNFFSSRSPFKRAMEAKLEGILERLEYLVNQKDVLDLRDGIREKPSFQKIPTTSVVDESCIYGRDDDKEAIMKLLLIDEAGNRRVGVIPIVGMGGIGKTTLAQIVYNDSKVQELFDLKAWVYVSEEFDISKITKDILEEVKKKTCDTMTLNQLQLELKTMLTGKKFLLVLDDVWSESHNSWEDCCKPLRFGARGSKIIVTTRNEKVASVMRTVPTHHLKQLNDDDCWSLFATHAFDYENSSAHPDLEVIGREIVKMCKGLPLAAKALGGLLRFERDAGKWERILKSNLWKLSNDDILPALRLSYHYLPSHLKRCFAYCAIFPKDHEFEREEVVRLWMAEGFIVQPKGNEEMKELGNAYFQDLISRSFFQQASGRQSYFIMHDLINDLAQFVSGEFCLRFGCTNSSRVGRRTRHIAYTQTKHDAFEKFEGIHEAQFLHTLLPLQLPGWRRGPKFIDDEVVHNSLLKFKRLRVLSLSQYRNIAQLPDSIGKLKHLRYLNLSATSITRLPETIGTLYNLQTLVLHGCQQLVELPTNTCRLTSLLHLDIRETQLQKMPSQMGKLTKLQQLTDFIVGKQSGSSIKELGKLQLLRGTLCIWNLQNVMDVQDALGGLLDGKTHLTELKLRWNGDTENSLHERAVLEQLKPHTNVECLSIFGYGGTRFPDWVGNCSFSKMVSLELSRCKYCHSLPPLGQLASLKELSISEFGAVVTIGPEFYGSCTSIEQPFISLEILRFERMAQWNEWISYAEEDEAFPLLRELYIKDCPNLIKQLPAHLPSLTTLKLEGCQQQLVATLPSAQTIYTLILKDSSCNVVLEKLPSGHYKLKANGLQNPGSVLETMWQMDCFACALEKIDIANWDSLKCSPLELFPKLKLLHIRDCPNLESLSAAQGPVRDFTSLSSLFMRNCSRLLSFPRGGMSAPNLKKLSLFYCSNLKSLPECMHSLLPSLAKLKIGYCPELEPFPKGGLPSKLHSLEILCCNKLILESFPEETLLPSTLKSLQINAMENLQSLEYKGLHHLTCLGKLMISNCNNLVSFPSEGLPTPSLKRLRVRNCTNLMSLPASMNSSLPSLVYLEILNCPAVGSFPEGGFPAKLDSLKIESCNELISGRMQWDLQTLPCLSHFCISSNEAVESFPEGMLLPSTLTSLQIRNLQNLKSLQYQGLQCLTSLRELAIWNCPELQSLPEEGLPSSLSSLSIRNCPLLKERCQPDEGEDWHRISHITSIEIDHLNHQR